MRAAHLDGLALGALEGLVVGVEQERGAVAEEAVLVEGHLHGPLVAHEVLAVAERVGEEVFDCAFVELGLAQMVAADLSYADLQSATLDDANLQYANLTRANLEGTYWSYSDQETAASRLSWITWNETICRDGTLSGEENPRCYWDIELEEDRAEK